MAAGVERRVRLILAAGLRRAAEGRTLSLEVVA